jgi:hypothetical protein
MSEELDLNDATVLANLPGKDIYGVPVGNLVNAIENAADTLAAKDAELARLRGVVEALRRGTLIGKSIVFNRTEDALAAASLATLPSPAEAGEKACKCGHADVDHNDPFLGKRFCFECEGDCPPAAPSDAKAGERKVGQPEQMKGAEDGFPGSDY